MSLLILRRLRQEAQEFKVILSYISKGKGSLGYIHPCPSSLTYPTLSYSFLKSTRCCPAVLPSTEFNRTQGLW